MPDVLDLGAAIAAQARNRPGAVALVWNDTEVTYADLLERAEAARLRLIGLNPAPGEPVCLTVTKSPEAVALVLACLLTGRPFLLPSATLPER
jgi:acyl-CoA synthetase (AMP-forming)/AMP-acid ligase II